MDNRQVETSVETRNAFYLLDDEAAKPTKAKPAPKKEEAPGKKAEPKTERPASSRNNKGEGRGRGRGGRGGRGGQRERRPPREGKREFDRHESGTGRDRNAKKGGAGKGNWGSDQGEAKDGVRRQRNQKVDDAEPAENKEEEKPEGEAEATEEKATEDKPKEDDEPAVVGFDEFMASKKALDEDLNRDLRVVDNDESNWKKCGTVSKKWDDGDDLGYELGSTGPKKGKGNKADKKKKASKVSLDEFGSAGGNTNGNQGGRGRGRARGGPRNGGGRGGRFNLASSDFPTLGGKK